ncbi:aspartyl-tRNA synthetase 2, mitochondrial [Homalodisca vitripennis]|nr:aspartyl-tRNA synthetase 2, mitochondrial [Homalodisca vitripennis]
MDVTLCGWIESKRNERFVVLRDGYGAAQLVINPIDFAVSRVVQNAEPNTLLTVRGRVSMRPSHQRNTTSRLKYEPHGFFPCTGVPNMRRSGHLK